MRRVHETTVVVVKAVSITYWSLCACLRVRAWVPSCVGVCMRIRACSLANPARNAYAPYCDVICGPWSPLYFSTRCDFRKKKTVLNKKCVSYFSLQLLSETFLILRRI